MLPANPQSIDRYLMFLRADLFLPYWTCFSKYRFSEETADTIQSAARQAVDDFMEDSESYWEVDFSDERHRQSIDLFIARCKGIPGRDAQSLALMQQAFCEGADEQLNIDFALTYIAQLKRNPQLGLTSGMTGKDIEIAVASVPPLKVFDTTFNEIEEAWLGSDSLWDAKLKNFTEDLPEYVFLNFFDAFNRSVRFPVLLSSLEHESGAFFARICHSLEQHFPEDSELKLPSLLAKKLD